MSTRPGRHRQQRRKRTHLPPPLCWPRPCTHHAESALRSLWMRCARLFRAMAYGSAARASGSLGSSAGACAGAGRGGRVDGWRCGYSAGSHSGGEKAAGARGGAGIGVLRERYAPRRRSPAGATGRSPAPAPQEGGEEGSSQTTRAAVSLAAPADGTTLRQRIPPPREPRAHLRGHGLEAQPEVRGLLPGRLRPRPCRRQLLRPQGEGPLDLNLLVERRKVRERRLRAGPGGVGRRACAGGAEGRGGAWRGGGGWRWGRAERERLPRACAGFLGTLGSPSMAFTWAPRGRGGRLGLAAARRAAERASERTHAAQMWRAAALARAPRLLLELLALLLPPPQLHHRLRALAEGGGLVLGRLIALRRNLRERLRAVQRRRVLPARARGEQGLELVDRLPELGRLGAEGAAGEGRERRAREGPLAWAREGKREGGRAPAPLPARRPLSVS